MLVNKKMADNGRSYFEIEGYWSEHPLKDLASYFTKKYNPSNKNPSITDGNVFMTVLDNGDSCSMGLDPRFRKLAFIYRQRGRKNVTLTNAAKHAFFQMSHLLVAEDATEILKDWCEEHFSQYRLNQFNEARGWVQLDDVVPKKPAPYLTTAHVLLPDEIWHIPRGLFASVF